MSSSNLNNQSIIMLGAGREGQATVAYLQKNYPDCKITLADQQAIELSVNGIELLLGEKYPSSLEKWDTVILSPGIPPHTALLRSAKAITTPTNIFFEDCRGKIIAVTGSKGKSTTASLIQAILQASGKPTHLVGNIGSAALAELHKHNQTSDIFVYELSSYQSSRLTKGADIVVVTSLYPDHLDYHGSLEQYYTDKLTVTLLQTASQSTIYNANNQELKKRAVNFPGQKISWPQVERAHVEKETVMLGQTPILPTKDIPLLGKHNVSNVLGAITVAGELDIAPKTIEQAIREFRPLPHRLETVGTYRQITFINDSIATVPEATLAALSAVTNVSTVLLGGTDRGYQWNKLIETLKKKKVNNVVLFPDSGANIKAALTKANYSPKLIETDSMAKAVAFAYKNTPPGATCLLSPGSPSYSMFANFAERGHAFTEEIKKQSN